MQSLLDALQAGSGVLAGVALLVAIAALVVALARRRTRTSAGQAAFAVDDPILDQLLASQMQRLDGVADELLAQGARIRAMEGTARHAVQRVGLVRYNPFEDTGGNQSFALALLDADANGVVLTSLHSRHATRVYLRTIVAGHCDAALSAEEAEALRQAGVSVAGGGRPPG
jgi:hypothetical protein